MEQEQEMGQEMAMELQEMNLRGCALLHRISSLTSLEGGG